MLCNFVAWLRDYYFVPYVILPSVFVWLFSTIFCVRLLYATSSRSKKFFLSISLFCSALSFVTCLIFSARCYVYDNLHVCDTPNLVFSGKISKFQIPVYGTEDQKDLITIKCALEFIEVDFIKPHSIRIFNENNPSTVLTFYEFEESHAHCLDGCENLCFKKKYLCLSNLWHEIDHIDAASLPEVAIVDWISISSYGDDFEYDSDSNINDHSFPRAGI